MATDFVEMYHPLIPSTVAAPVRVRPQAEDDHAARGWLRVDGAELPTPETPYYTTQAADSRFVRDSLLGTRMADHVGDGSAFDLAQRAAFVPQWAPLLAVTAGDVFLAPDGRTIVRNADGATRASYDATEQAAWTPVAADIDPSDFAPAVDRIIRFWGDLDSSAGSFASTGQHRVATLADSSNSNATGAIDFPSDWSTYDVTVVWTNMVATAGAAVMRYEYMAIVDGVLGTVTPGFKDPVTVTAGAQFAYKFTELATAVPVDPTGPNMVKVLRFGNDAADTLAGAIGIVAIICTKAS